MLLLLAVWSHPHQLCNLTGCHLLATCCCHLLHTVSPLQFCFLFLFQTVYLASRPFFANPLTCHSLADLTFCCFLAGLTNCRLLARPATCHLLAHLSLLVKLRPPTYPLLGPILPVISQCLLLSLCVLFSCWIFRTLSLNSPLCLSSEDYVDTRQPLYEED